MATAFFLDISSEMCAPNVSGLNAQQKATMF